ncbi:hypothetical protein D3C87_2071500 [compost metagenome]
MAFCFSQMPRAFSEADADVPERLVHHILACSGQRDALLAPVPGVGYTVAQLLLG